MSGQDFGIPTGPLPEAPKGDAFPPGWYSVRIAGCTPQIQESTGKLVVDVEFRTLDKQHPSHISDNVPVFITIWIGTDADPTGRDPRTYTDRDANGRPPGFAQFGALCTAAGVPYVGRSLVEACQELVSKHVIARFVPNKEGDRTRAYRYQTVGTREPSVDDGAMDGAAGGAQAPAPAPAAASAPSTSSAGGIGAPAGGVGTAPPPLGGGDVG